MSYAPIDPVRTPEEVLRRVLDDADKRLDPSREACDWQVKRADTAVQEFKRTSGDSKLVKLTKTGRHRVPPQEDEGKAKEGA